MLGILAFLVSGWFHGGKFSTELKWFSIGLISSLSALIIVHELLHAAAFLLLGKTDIGFGAQPLKFIFYAEANRQVLGKREMIIVALAPLIIISICCIVFSIVVFPSPVFLLGVVIFLIHFFFCAGDIALVSYFLCKKELYTYDDRNERKTYYYQRINNGADSS